MSTRFSIEIDLGGLIPEGAPINDTVFPNLANAVTKVTAGVQRQWVGFAMGEALPNGETITTRTGTYARSIQTRRLGDFRSEVYSDSPHANVVERGAPERDLKRMLDTSFKVRVTSRGKRYLIIPFRWGTPGTVGFRNVMPDVAHAFTRQMAPSSITRVFRRRSGTGAFDPHTRRPVTVAARRYLWGDRLSSSALAGMGITGSAARHMAGMVRMQRPTSRGTHTTYLTFRVMHEDSRGWIARAIPGKWPARTTADLFRPVAERAFRAAVEADIRGILGAPE